MASVYTTTEARAFAAGCEKVRKDRDMQATERIAKALEMIVEMMQEDRRTGQ